MTHEQAMNRLAECRDAIDAIDVQLLALVNERTRVVEEIGRIKRMLNMPIYEPRREDEVYRNVTNHNGGPLSTAAVHRVFERIIDEARSIQRERMIEAERTDPEGNS